MIANSGLSPLRGLAKLRDVRSRRFSSFDRTGGRSYYEHSGTEKKIPAYNAHWAIFLGPATRNPATLSVCLCK